MKFESPRSLPNKSASSQTHTTLKGDFTLNSAPNLHGDHYSRDAFSDSLYTVLV